MKYEQTNTGSRNNFAEDKKPARSKDTNLVDDISKGRKDAPVQESEKRTLAASQTAEAPESLRCPESRKSTPEDNVTQERTELSEKRTKPVISDNTEQSMAKDCIETVDVDNDEEMSNMDMRLGYFGLGLHDQMEIPETDKLLEVIGQIEGRSAKILLDTRCSIYVLSSSFAKRNGISRNSR